MLAILFILQCVTFTYQALSRALTELRAEMVAQAQDEVKAHADQTAAEFNVQKMVDKQTKELKVGGWEGRLVKLWCISVCWWLGTKLQKLHCISSGVSAVLG